MRKKKNSHQSKNVARDASIGVNTLHFFSCEEPARIQGITDVANNRTFTLASNPGVVTFAQGGKPGINVNMLAPPAVDTSIDGYWIPPGANDWAIFSCGRSIFQGMFPYDGGGINFYLGDVDKGFLRVQPYISTWMIDPAGIGVSTPYNNISTPVYYPNMRLTENTDYISAAVKHGRYLEHWFDGVMVGRADIETLLKSVAQESDPDNKAALQGVYDKWYNNNAADSSLISLGHSIYNAVSTTLAPGDAGYLPHLALSEYPHHDPADLLRETPGAYETDAPNGYTGQAVNEAQDFYGLLVQQFPEGAPDDIGASMNYHKERWPHGDKVIWPAWYK